MKEKQRKSISRKLTEALPLNENLATVVRGGQPLVRYMGKNGMHYGWVPGLVFVRLDVKDSKLQVLATHTYAPKPDAENTVVPTVVPQVIPGVG